MAEHLPYRETLFPQLAELPLPDVNMAWADMRRRLEEDDDDGGAIPFWRRRGCLLWGILLALLVGMGWWWSQSGRWSALKQTGTEQQKEKQERQDQPSGEPGDHDTLHARRTIQTGDTSIKKNTAGTITGGMANEPGSFKANVTIPAEKRVTTKNRATKTLRVEIKARPGKRGVVKKGNQDIPPQGDPVLPQKNRQPQLPQDTVTRKEPGIITREWGMPDTSQLTTTDTIARQNGKPVTSDSTTTGTSQKKKNEDVPHFFSAGIALHQQLPVNGQTFTPYNASGRRGTLADYIPSVYIRFHHGDRWFLQTGFRYGAPQYNKELTYDRIKDIAINTDTLLVLKKTYYHQLPLTFHYRLLPGLTLGAGVVWNRFSSAVSSQQILKPANIPSQDTLLGETIVRVKKNDSVFSRSYFQATTELQYKWRRFSIGAAYSFGLQPYIKFSLPGGTQQKERNSSLQVFLRYELWKSTKQ